MNAPALDDLRQLVEQTTNYERSTNREVERIGELEDSFRREAAQRATQWKKLGVVTSGWNSGKDQCSSKRVTGFILAPGSRKRFDEVVHKTGSHTLTV